MLEMATAENVGIALGILTILTILIGALRWLRPRWRSAGRTWVAFRDTFLGRDEIVDTTTPGRIIEPALPPLGVRLANVESAVSELVKQDARLTHVEGDVATLKGEVADLKLGRVERVVTQAESAAMLNMVERLHEVDPSPRPDPPEGS